jgi:hypothetical protein
VVLLSGEGLGLGQPRYYHSYRPPLLIKIIIIISAVALFDHGSK